MTEKGNALFLILIAVALFAALSYAITQSGRGGGTVENEQAAIQAAQITSAATLVKNGVMRMVISGHPIVVDPAADGTDCCFGASNGHRNFCTTGTDCLFAPEGGGVTPPSFPAAAFDMGPLAGATAFQGPDSFLGFTIDGFDTGPDVSLNGMGTAAEDDMLYVFPLKEKVCLAINKGLGIDTIPSITDWNPTDAVANIENVCIRDQTSGGVYLYIQLLNAN